MKSNRAAMKRFRLTGTGKIKRDHQGTGHLFTGKPRSLKRRLKASGLVARPDEKRIRRLIMAGVPD